MKIRVKLFEEKETVLSVLPDGINGTEIEMDEEDYLDYADFVRQSEDWQDYFRRILTKKESD